MGRWCGALLGLVYDGFGVEFSALFTPFLTTKEKCKARILQSQERPNQLKINEKLG
jgi:hypothetical protein